MNLGLKKFVGNATDGVENMQGKYRGFSPQLSNMAQKQIHIMVLCSYTELGNC
jgi:hypothetical protein